MLVVQSCRLFATPWTAAHRAPLFKRFSRQEYWSGLPFPSPGNLPNPGIEPGLLHCRKILYRLSPNPYYSQRSHIKYHLSGAGLQCINLGRHTDLQSITVYLWFGSKPYFYLYFLVILLHTSSSTKSVYSCFLHDAFCFHDSLTNYIPPLFFKAAHL